MRGGARPPRAEPTDPGGCRRRALDLLARREHSRLELERKLAGCGYAADVVAGALDQLEAEGLLDARRFLESFVRARVSRLQGPARIRAELTERGIGAAEARALLEDGEHDWMMLASRARTKRFGPTPPADLRERARQARFLRYRGFESAQIEAALDLAPVSD